MPQPELLGMPPQNVRHISALDNPQEAAQVAQNLMNEPVVPTSNEPVLVSEPPAATIELPGGVVHNDEVITTAEVRELNGEDEEHLAKFVALPKLYREILSLGVVKVGEHPADKGLLNSMLVGDRDRLIMGIRQATYGDEIEMSIECPACQNRMEMKYSLTDDVPMHRLDEPGKYVFDVELRNGRTAEVVLPTGAAQDAVFEAAEKKATLAELNTVLLAQCVVAIDGQKLALPMQQVKRLSMSDRRTIIDFLNSKQPGPKYGEVKTPCSGCGREFPLTIDLVDMFRL